MGWGSTEGWAMPGHPQPSPGHEPAAPRQSQVGHHHVLRECPHTAKSEILTGFAQGDHGRVPTHQGTRKTDAEGAQQHSREGHWTLAGPLCLWQFLKGQRRLGAQASSLSLSLRQGVQVHTTPRFPVPSPRTHPNEASGSPKAGLGPTVDATKQCLAVPRH